ncbi:MAG: hypothetical protein FJX11_07380 [Alphaproteobacteria bacterium]|nr:hypothetical protein [Alphaproteobacteria bacterium]
MRTPHPRRAGPADAASLAGLSPAIVPTDSDDRAVFVIDGAAGPQAAIDLARQPDHIRIEHLVGSPRHCRRLLDHAAAAARAMQVGELRWSGFPGGRRRVRNGPLQRAHDYLDRLGVPLWRDGTATLSQTLYFRGTWAALALLVGLGSVSLAVFSGIAVTWAHIALPSLLAAAGSAMAVWQIGLIVAAARRSGIRLAFTATAAIAAAVIVAIGALVLDRAVPAIREMWAIYTGDDALADLTVSVGRDGRTLFVEGSYGMGSEAAVRAALERNPDIRTVVLAGPGGRASVGFDLFRLFHERRLATRVDGTCASACTIAFLGGVERSVSPSGRLGFHRASFPGMSDADMHESNRDLRRFYLHGAKLAPAFVDRVMDTSPDALWVPTPQELLAGRAITRVNR